jgi:hypothetical protein
MFSPYKFTSEESNSFCIGQNHQLAEDVSEFFKNYKTNPLWLINTSRQRMSEALKHTAIIDLRIADPSLTKSLTNTLQFNDVTQTQTTKVYESFPLFQSMMKWAEQAIRDAGANDVEFGRAFFSKHHANTDIGLHTDSGVYFDYYDRFHFVIDQVDLLNIFQIRDEPLLLEKGKLYWVNNHVPHFLKNNSNQDRINLIFDARLT